METKTASQRMHSVVIMYDMHSDYFKKALDGISDEDSLNRLNTKANHISWIAGSLVQERFELAGKFGSEMVQKSVKLFENFKGIQDDLKYPPLEEYKSEWDRITPVLREYLINVSDEKLNSIIKYPQFEITLYELLNFMIYREANMIGQIALWRRLLGYDAMKYM